MNQKKTFLLLGLLITFLIIGVVFFVSSSKFSGGQKVASGSSWEIVVSYNPLTEKISLKKIDLIASEVLLDTRSVEPNAYDLSVIGQDGKKLLTTKVFISTGFVFNIYNGGNLDYQGSVEHSESHFHSAVESEPQEIESVIYIPAVNDAKEIIISKSNTDVLKITLPYLVKNTQTNQIAQAACGALEIAFISDGYTDFGRFRQDVERLKQAFLSTNPYSKNPNMFVFHVVENTTPLGCVDNLYCVSNSIIPQVGRSQYPSASKFVVLANVTYNNPPSGTALGVINGVGGYVTAFPRSAILNGREAVDQIAIHELLGHGVGGLYDRYVLEGSASVRRNCSNSSLGESFWKDAGVTQTYPGCYSEFAYAPAPNNCNASLGSGLVSGGSTGSIMSAAGCGSSVFDPTETYYLENFVLPKYNACANITASNTPAPTINECDPDSSGASAGIIDFADLRLVRREIAGLVSTSRAACITGGQSTTFADLRKIRRIIAGLE